MLGKTEIKVTSPRVTNTQVTVPQVTIPQLTVPQLTAPQLTIPKLTILLGSSPSRPRQSQLTLGHCLLDPQLVCWKAVSRME